MMANASRRHHGKRPSIDLKGLESLIAIQHLVVSNLPYIYPLMTILAHCINISIHVCYTT